jgi:hypothetical protein
MERAERFVFLGVGLAFNILVPILWIMLVLTAFTAVQRFVRVYRAAGRPPRPAHPRKVDRNGAPLRTWWVSKRTDGERTRVRHRTERSERRRARP